MIKTRSIRLSSGVTTHHRGGRERRDGGHQREREREDISNKTWLNSTKLFFSYRILQNENIYVHYIKKRKHVSSPAVYHLGITRPSSVPW